MTTPAPQVLRGIVLRAGGQAIGRRSAVASSAAPRQGDARTVAQPHPDPATERARLEVLRAAHAEGLQRGRAEAQAEQARTAQAAALECEARARQHASEHQERVLRLDRLLQAFPAAAAKRLAELEQDTVALAHAAVCRIVGGHAHDLATLEHLVRCGLEQLQGGVLERIRLHPDDLASLRQHEAGRALLDRHAAVAWVADPNLQAGGLLLDTAAGTLDARIDTQLRQLRQAWVQALAAPEA